MRIFFNEYKDNIGKQLVWFLTLLIIFGVLIFAYPVINDAIIKDSVVKSIDSLPEKVLSLLLPYGKETFSDLNLYYLSLVSFLSIFVSIFAIEVGSNSLIKEQTSGNIEFIYMNPIDRSDIYFNKWFANFFNILILCILFLFSTSYLCGFIENSKDFRNVEIIEIAKNNLKYFYLIFANAILFMSIGTFISSLTNRISNIGGINFLFVFLIILLNILISFNILKVDSFLIKFLPYKSFILMADMDFMEILIKSLYIKWLPAVLFTIFGLLIYNNKDLVI